MKLSILSSAARFDSNRRLVQVAKQRGHHVEPPNTLGLKIGLDLDKPEKRKALKPLPTTPVTEGIAV